MSSNLLCPTPTPFHYNGLSLLPLIASQTDSTTSKLMSELPK